jgi:hypothetical protein
MGLGNAIKRAILTAAIEKRKKANPFDAVYSDNFELAPDADEWQNNSHYFSMHNGRTGEALFYRFARRGGAAPDEVWFFWRLPAQTGGADGVVVMAESDAIAKGAAIPAKVQCVEAGKTLFFSYRGKVKKGRLTEKGYVPDEASPSVEADFEGTFSGTADIFEFSRHMSSGPIVSAMMREKLSGEFRKAMQQNHQVHYEQPGLISGKLKIPAMNIDRNFKDELSFRDHSYGKRDWGYMVRHIWLAAVVPPAGLRRQAEYLNISMTAYPALRELQAGFYTECKMGIKPVSIKSATRLDDFPNVGCTPKQFEFTAEYEDGRVLNGKCTTDFAGAYSFTKGAYEIYEGVADFDFGDFKGRGIAEFGFNPNLPQMNADEHR